MYAEGLNPWFNDHSTLHNDKMKKTSEATVGNNVEAIFVTCK